jgi:hypothetical protein
MVPRTPKENMDCKGTENQAEASYCFYLVGDIHNQEIIIYVIVFYISTGARSQWAPKEI